MLEVYKLIIFYLNVNATVNLTALILHTTCSTELYWLVINCRNVPSLELPTNFCCGLQVDFLIATQCQP